MARVQTGGAVALLTTLALTCAALAGEKTAWRLFVSDHSESIVNVIDLLKQEKIEAFGDKIVVTDPSRGVVSLVDATSLTKTSEIALGTASAVR